MTPAPDNPVEAAMREALRIVRAERDEACTALAQLQDWEARVCGAIAEAFPEYRERDRALIIVKALLVLRGEHARVAGDLVSLTQEREHGVPYIGRRR